ncbi:MAG: cation-translocating P-type ATPase [Patescibacteria group bacterium]
MPAAPRNDQFPISNFQNGLTSAEAKKRLEEFGPNALPKKPPPSDFRIFVAQLKSPLVYILLVAGLVTLFLREYSDATMIFFAVFVNTILGFFQERKASKALEALKKLIHPRANVLRDGKVQDIDVAEVVPGDIVILHQGDKIPAGGEVIEANRFFASEAILTGESVPVAKKVKDSVFMGTVVTSGIARMEVKLTGGKTEIGKIAILVQELDGDTPLRRQLAHFSKQLSFLVVGLVVFVFVVGLATEKEAGEIFTISVALAVSAIPEGLLVGLTVVLAIGMQRILAKKGLVRRLVSAETLGGVTVICVDKTGTLTSGHMQVVGVEGEKDALAKQAILANDLDDPIVIAAYDWARQKLAGSQSGGQAKAKIRELERKHARLDSIPFSSKDRFFASLNKGGSEVDSGSGNNTIFVNGAPEFLVEWTDLGSEEKKEIKDKIEELSKEGKRLLGMAEKKVPFSKKKLTIKDVKSDLTWKGILSFSDPVRKGVREAFEKTKQAGIATIVITGDYPQTAISVMKQLDFDLDRKKVILGQELKRMNTIELAKKLEKKDGVALFARTTPEQKLNIVDALKRNNEAVAMMGDGVNDAPALNKADIGIVVGEASDVAKETADLVLLDSSFATIVAAVEQGRNMFDNIRKIILYLMSDAFEGIFAVIGTIILNVTLIPGLALPVTAAQILWINIISDGFPHLALTVDPKRSGLMNMPPRNPKEELVAPWMRWLILIVSIYGGIVALGLFTYIYITTDNLSLARSVAFATLGVNSLIYVFSVRTLRQPFWIENPLDNKWLNLAVFVGLFFQLIPFALSPLRKFLGLEVLSPLQWIAVFSAAGLMFILIEISKYFFRHKLVVKHK